MRLASLHELRPKQRKPIRMPLRELVKLRLVMRPGNDDRAHQHLVIVKLRERLNHALKHWLAAQVLVEL
jgi:hypothetical protein